MVKSCHIIIEGRVQGVFFRSNIKKRAQKLSLVGWVKNTFDGNVEVLIQGDKKKINKLIEYCKKGPIFARVNNVKVKEINVKELKNFKVRY